MARLARVLTPPRGDVIDIDSSLEEADLGRSAAPAKNDSTARESKNENARAEKASRSSPDFFGSDADFDPALFDEIDEIERAALAASPAPPARPTPAPSQRSQPKLTQSTPAASQVIVIDDEDEDKENVPVPTRRVRRRIEREFDPDVIDLSD